MTTPNANSPDSDFSLINKRICLISAQWHDDIVDELKQSFLNKSAEYGLENDCVDTVIVPGSLEIPLQAKLRAKTGLYDAIVVTGLVVDGGIYRHEFVAKSILESVMQLQLELELPIIYAVLTPHHFHDGEVHQQFFSEHFKTKGVETANALYQTLRCCAETAALTQSE
ncbi:MAG: 6,7-dimethyl-8-ribityllumazine synthase [Thiolinea sp.]